MKTLEVYNDDELGKLVREELKQWHRHKNYQRDGLGQDQPSFPLFDPYTEFSYQNPQREVGGQITLNTPLDIDCHTTDAEVLAQIVPRQLLDPEGIFVDKLRQAVKGVIDQEMISRGLKKP